jgi:pimeloyl-ACP methyl ester carboxylesterase
MQLEVISREPRGEGRPTPILFVHGMWHGAWCWDEHFLPYFARHGYAVHALSLRGHGASEGHERLRWSSLADYVADVEQVAARLPAPPVLVGHSMGGAVIQKYLSKHQAPAVALLASMPPQGFLPATLRIARLHPLAFLKIVLTLSMYPAVSTPELCREMFFSAGMPEDQVAAHSARVGNESFRAYLETLPLFLSRPPGISTPLLILGAADDLAVSVREAENTAQTYGTRAEIFPDMAHDMMLEAGWQAVADRILAWLDEQGL